MTSTSQTRLWTRDFALLLASTVLVWSSFFFLLPVLPLYVVQRLGGTPTQVGMLGALLGVTAIAGRLLSGWAADRWGRRVVQLFFLALFCAVVFGYNLATTLAILALMRFLHGFPFGAGTTAAMVVASDLVPPQRRGEGLGYYNLAQTAANALGPALAFAILDRGGFGGLFNAAGLLGVGALVLAWFIRHPLVRDPEVRLSVKALFEGRVGWISVSALFIALGYSGVVTFITLYAEELRVANPGLFFTLYALGFLLVRPMAGRVFDRRGPRWVVAGGLVLMVAAYLMLAWWRVELGFLVAGFVFGVGYGATIPSLQAMAVERVPPTRRGAANATLFAIFDIGMTVGPYLNGVLAEGSGYAATYLAGAALLSVAGAVFYATGQDRVASGHP